MLKFDCLKKTFLSMLFLCVVTNAQIKVHKNFSVNEGLVQGQISSMIQDSKGYIWFGTYNGVSRWDGKNFMNLQTHNGLPSAQITDIKEGKDGKIYIATFRGGILVYHHGNLDTLKEKNGLVTNAVTNINILRNGDIIFGGLNGRITKLKDDKLENWSEEINFPNSAAHVVWDSYEAENGTIYFATQNGLMIYENNKLKNITTNDGLNHNLLRSVTGDSKGTIYIGSYRGVNKYINGNVSSLNYKGKELNSFVINILIASDGTVYYATTEGVIKEKENHVELLTEQNGLVFNDCWSILEDYNGTIYLGSNGKGLSIYNPKEPIINFTKKTGLQNESIWAIHEDRNGTFYFGSVDGLIMQKLNSSKILRNENGLTGNYIREVFEDRNGKILVATNSGLNVLSNTKIINYTTQDGLLANQVHAIAETDSGVIFLGTQNGVSILRDGLCDKNKSEIITDEIKKGLNVTNIQTVTVTQNDELFFGTFNGIAIYKKNTFTFLTTANGLIDNVINTMFESSSGLIYAGTFKGINIIKNGEVIDTIDVNDGLSNNAISDICEDNSNRIFVSTFHGLNILQYENEVLSIRNIFKKDGLIDDDFTQEGSFIDKSGNLWLGTLYGVSKYNTSADLPIKNPPKIYITGLEIFNEKYSLLELEKNGELYYDQNYIKFIYTGINLSAPDKIVYNYRLGGVDKHWVTSKENYVQYTNLDDGKYTFEVKAQNEWGYWSKPASLTFVIRPAWWETWWFRLTIISTLVFLLWLVFQYRLNYLLKLERLRTKIASDLHDEVGSLLTQISINVDSLTYTKDEEKRKEKSNFIRTKSSEVINMMSDVIWSIDSRNDNMESLVDRIHNFAQSFSDQKNIKLNFNKDLSNSDKQLKIDFRQNIMMIAKEAINNSVKYSGCSELSIDIISTNGMFELVVADNGKGVNFENIKYGNGLKNLKMRAESVGAKIDFLNKDGFKVHLTKNKF